MLLRSPLVLLRVLFALGASALLVPPALLAVLVTRLDRARGLRWRGWLMHRWARLLCTCLGVRVAVQGPAPARPAFLAPNHVSYLDVIVLGSLCEGFFVSRADVAEWPVLGSLARLGNTIFLERERRRDTRRAAGDAESVLRHGARLLVFLEGRAGPGGDVQPFKPSLLEAAVRTGVPCVPVALSYRLPRHPEADTGEVVAWHDSTPLHVHAWRLLSHGPVEAVMRVLPERRGGDRKVLARQLEGDVRAALGALHAAS